MEAANIGNYKATEDWYFLLPAILLIDTLVLFFTRYAASMAGKPLNQWYDDFGLAAVLSDVTIIAIGIAITRYVYTYFFQEQEGWNIWYFVALAILIQVLHDTVSLSLMTVYTMTYILFTRPTN